MHVDALLTALARHFGVPESPPGPALLDAVAERLDGGGAGAGRLDSAIERVAGMARLELRGRLPIRGVDPQLDALALGLNFLAEELHGSTVARSYLNRLFGALGEALFVVDGAGVVVDVNPMAEQMTGREGAELVGSAFSDHVSGLDWVSDLGAAVARGRAVDQALFVNADGATTPTRLVVTPVSDREGAPSFVCVAADLTWQKQLEAALSQALAEAVSAVEQKSTFLANMSHEIRTPINGVVGMTGLLLNTSLSAPQREMADAIESSGRALLDVVNDILDFSKIEAGMLELESLHFDLHEVCEEIVALHAYAAQTKGLELILDVRLPEPFWVHGDAGRIRQVLNNLLSNAVKFTDAGEVTLSVGPERHGVAFGVRDAGIGMTPQTMAQVFDSFTQADSSTSRRYGGSGLGLTVCRELVLMMEGTLDCQSLLGEGSEFTVHLPLLPTEPPHGRLSEDPQTALVGIPVLAVDDNPTNLRVLGLQLQSWGARPVLATCAEEALERARQATASGDPARVHVLDHQMPGWDGLELARALLVSDDVAPAPTILLTSLAEPPAAVELRRAGVGRFLTKPCRPRRLRRAIVQLLRGGSDPVANLPSNGLPELATRTRVLVVEDNAINQKVALGYLRSYGFAADAVADGNEALEALGRIPYGLVLMDVRMPVMDGFAATRAIREMVLPGGRPIVLGLSADATEETRQRCLDVGMDDFVPKPVTEGRLRSALLRWLPAQEWLGEAEETPPPGASRPVAAGFCFDPAPLEKLIQLSALTGETALWRETLDGFRTQCPERLSALQAAVAAGHREARVDIAHAWRGMCLTTGAVALARLCERIERAGDETSSDALHAMMERVEEEMNRTLAKMEAFALTRG